MTPIQAAAYAIAAQPLRFPELEQFATRVRRHVRGQQSDEAIYLLAVWSVCLWLCAPAPIAWPITCTQCHAYQNRPVRR